MSRLRRVFRFLRNIAVFLAALASGCFLIHSQLPVPYVSAVQAKLEKLKANPSGYDTLFFGTSRIYHQVIPSEFDGILASHGIETKSFNAGVDGMRPPEDGYFFDQFLKFKPKGVKWVFLELDEMQLAVDPKKRGTSRVVYWHDFERMSLLFRKALAARKSTHLGGIYREVHEPFADFLEHCGIFCENMTNIGRSEHVIETFVHPKWPWVYWPPLGSQGDGFLEIADRQTLSEKDRVLYQETLERREKAIRVAREDYGDAVSQDALWRLLARIRSIGAEPILVITPTTAGKKFVPEPGRGVVPPIFDFSNLNEYSVLYEEKYRLDTDHLNTEGAKLFTQLLADKFIQLQKRP